MKCLYSTFVLILFVSLWTAQLVYGQETFSFQGRLTTPEGMPVPDGSYGIQFQLFDASTGGSPLWAEGHSVTTSDGVFSVMLGTKATLKLDAFADTPQLQLIVDEAVLSPRTLLTAVPYAMKSYRLDEQALVAGDNVSITRRSDGTLRIGATGGGGTGGLTSVATDATMEGNGTSANPLGLADGSVTGEKLSNNALLAGANVDIVRRGNGSWEISSTGSGGLAQVASDPTLAGDGTSDSPLQVADGAVTGVKLADGALVAGANVTITRQAAGAFEVASTGSGGLAQVASDATLSGDGTAGSPLQVAAPLVLTGSESTGVVRGEHSNGNYGYLGGNTAVQGFHNSGNFGLLGTSHFGAQGFHNSGNFGLLGTSNFGVYGRRSGNEGYIAGSSVAVYGEHGNGNNGYLGGSTYGVFGAGPSSGFAAGFSGDVTIIGNLAKSSGSFKIDHPLDPANKYLSHSFVESPDMKNVYDGNATLDANGEAIVTLPDYFEALNRDFRYQLTAIGAPGPNLYVAEEIAGNRFKIAGGQPGMKVSWQVTGIRQDAWAEENRIVVEEDKPAKERGFYLHPTLFGQPPQRSVEWARDPEMMREMQELSAQSVAERRHSEEEDQHLP